MQIQKYWDSKKLNWTPMENYQEILERQGSVDGRKMRRGWKKTKIQLTGS